MRMTFFPIGQQRADRLNLWQTLLFIVNCIFVPTNISDPYVYILNMRFSILLNMRQEKLVIKPPTLQLMDAPLNCLSYMSQLLSGTMRCLTSNKKKKRSVKNTGKPTKRSSLKLIGCLFEPQQQDIFKMGIIRNPLGFSIKKHLNSKQRSMLIGAVMELPSEKQLV